jgi:hypothetical protein
MYTDSVKIAEPQVRDGLFPPCFRISRLPEVASKAILGPMR